jgi:hypothetical protein
MEESMDPRGMSLTWNFAQAPTAGSVARALREVTRYPLPEDLDGATLVLAPEPGRPPSGFRIDLFLPTGTGQEDGDD